MIYSSRQYSKSKLENERAYDYDDSPNDSADVDKLSEYSNTEIERSRSVHNVGMISEDEFADNGDNVRGVEGDSAKGEDCVDRYDRREGEETEQSCTPRISDRSKLEMRRRT